MLLRCVFLILLLATLAETFVHGAGALAQATLRRTASLAVQAQLAAASTSAQRAVAAAVAAGGDPQTLDPVAPQPLATCVVATPSGCALQGIATVSFAVPAAAPSPCPSDACTVYVQGNDAVTEGRIDATIAATAVTSQGVPLASRTQRVTFRTMRSPPFAAIAGALDASIDALDGRGPGEDAGAAPHGTAPGSLIDVLYEDAKSGRSIPANVWRARTERSGATAGAWSP